MFLIKLKYLLPTRKSTTVTTQHTIKREFVNRVKFYMVSKISRSGCKQVLVSRYLIQWANLSKIICINDGNLATNTTWLLFITFNML